MLMLRNSLPALLGLALLAAACGSEPPIQLGDGGKKLEDAPRYFGIEPCKCYEYRSLDPAEPRLLGVAVERVDDFYADQGDPNEKYALVYRLGGAWQMRYVLDPAQKPDLLLSRVYTGEGATDDEWRMDPPVPLLRYPVEPGPLVRQDTVAVLHHNGLPVAEGEEIEFQAAYADTDEITASLDGENFETFQATRVEYFNTPWGEQYRWFVPEVGNVQLEVKLKSMQRATKWVLQNVRTLDDSCPGVGITDFCGVQKNP